MDDVENSASSNRHVIVRPCRRCAARKVRCDKQQPCDHCLKHKAECEYPSQLPVRRTRKQGQDAIERGRLKQYHRSLLQKNADIAPPLQDPDPDPASTLPLGVDPETRLLRERNRSKYLDSPLWARVVEEFAEPGDALGQSSDEESNEDDMSQDDMDFLLGLTPKSTTTYGSHPSSDHALTLWQIFLENVDPLTKVIHGPSLHPIVEKAIIDLKSVPKSLDALLFAIYGAAIVSLKDKECERRFGELRGTLLKRYRLATKTALSKAKFLGSANLVVLQAFLIHLLTMRESYDSRTLWTLTGVALRIAEGMGLHRDGASLMLPPFETEIRRRIWWQLRLLNGDAAELTGLRKFGIYDTDEKAPKRPSNINDNDWYPGLSAIPTAVDQATDMIFCALRYELRFYWTSKRSKDDSLWNSFEFSAAEVERDKAIDEFEHTLETKYVRFCDPSQPIQLLAILVARAGVSTARLLAHHPRRWANGKQVSDSERQFVWELSIKGLRQYNMIHSNRELQRFSWHAAFYFRWHVFIHILDTLRAKPLISKAAEVWQMIDDVYETNPEFVTNTRKAVYVAVGSLCLKAYEARETALVVAGRTISPTPSYIIMFRRQREASNKNRQAQDTVVASPSQSTSGTFRPNHDVYAAQELASNAAPRSQERNLPPQIHQTFPPSSITASHQPGAPGDGIDSWLSDSNSQQMHGLFTSVEDSANMDLDYLLNADALMDDSNNLTIDWVKWDALISNVA